MNTSTGKKHDLLLQSRWVTQARVILDRTLVKGLGNPFFANGEGLGGVPFSSGKLQATSVENSFSGANDLAKPFEEEHETKKSGKKDWRKGISPSGTRNSDTWVI